MAVMRKHRVFSNWDRGPSGSLSRFETEYNSSNAQVYENGSLGPRPGWRDWTPHDLGDDSPAQFDGGLDLHRRSTLLWAPRGGELGLLILSTGLAPGTVVGADGEHQMFTVMYVDRDGLQTPATMFDNNSYGRRSGQKVFPHPRYNYLKPVTWNAGPLGFFVMGGLLIHVGHWESSLTLNVDADIEDGTVHGSVVVPYREQLYAATSDGHMIYSQPRLEENEGGEVWPDTNEVIVSPSGGVAVMGLYPLGNSLLIARTDDTWMLWTGTTHEDGTLRELDKEVVPFWGCGAVADRKVWYLSRVGLGVLAASATGVSKDLWYLSPLAQPGVDTERPVSQTGDYMEFAPSAAVSDEVTGGVSLQAVEDLSSVMLAAERVNGVWVLSRSDFSWAEGALGQWHGTHGEANTMWACCLDVPEGDGTYPIGGATAPEAFHILSREFTLNRPAKSDDLHSRPLSGEHADGMTIALGTIKPSGPGLVRPVKLVLEIDYWKGGGFETPELEVGGTIMGAEASDSTFGLQQQTAATEDWADGQRKRKRQWIRFEQAPYGQGIDIDLFGDGWALHRAIVYYEEQEDVW